MGRGLPFSLLHRQYPNLFKVRITKVSHLSPDYKVAEIPIKTKTAPNHECWNQTSKARQSNITIPADLAVIGSHQD